MKQGLTDNFEYISRPAQRALANAGIKSLIQLSKKTEKEILSLHGMGPNAIGKLAQELKKQKLTFRN